MGIPRGQCSELEKGIYLVPKKGIPRGQYGELAKGIYLNTHGLDRTRKRGHPGLDLRPPGPRTRIAAH